VIREVVELLVERFEQLCQGAKAVEISELDLETPEERFLGAVTPRLPLRVHRDRYAKRDEPRRDGVGRILTPLIGMEPER
jgi:hypothetical protein